MGRYQGYLMQLAALRRKAKAARRAEAASAIREARRLIADFGLTASDIGMAAPVRKRVRSSESTDAPAADPHSSSRRTALAGRKIAPKYCGPGGELWTGRGRQPAWVRDALAAGRTLADLAI